MKAFYVFRADNCAMGLCLDKQATAQIGGNYGKNDIA